MRAVLWDLLLLCLFAHVLSDCQRDCLSCDRHMYSQWDGFNVLVCVLECEGQAVPRATWELCAAASAGPREEEEEDDDDDYNDAADAAMARPFEVEEAAGLRGAGPRPAMAAAVAAAARRAAQVSALLRQRAAEDGGSKAPPEQPADVVAQRPGARPPAEPRRLAAPAARGVQKRYGGFIGVRKKRFSEFLKQYLGMSPRSSEYDIAADLNEHNEI
ncbi:prepronociceptin isoform X1 [Apteryx mantelli]|uniref:Prepronociceptin isoform X1 n=1 Tax=Apteryx mantelli TaxID=2696672 RepID=A0ABM4ECY0_9AVES